VFVSPGSKRWIFVAIAFVPRTICSERNLAGAAVLGLLAVAARTPFPPLAWKSAGFQPRCLDHFSLTYRVLCIFFGHLGDIQCVSNLYARSVCT